MDAASRHDSVTKLYKMAVICSNIWKECNNSTFRSASHSVFECLSVILLDKKNTWACALSDGDGSGERDRVALQETLLRPAKNSPGIFEIFLPI